MTEVISPQCHCSMPPATRYEPKSYSKKRLFGFHLTDDALECLIQRMTLATADKPSQNEEETEETDEMYLYVDMALSHIRKRCRAVWKDGYFLFAPVYFGNYQANAFGFRSIPEPEILERIQRVLAEEGFTEPPTWYNVIG